ncbi:acyltransferase [Bacteroides graminisolvens]|uniref:acyltransferase n=1 Tax=Bacteroides graminisolvens TaxID=477666 RepID=UPI0029C73213|nr:acyltransferase [Bacteroides graminisolvens]
MLSQLFTFVQFFKALYFRYRVKRKCAVCGSNLHVNGKSVVFGVVKLGDNVNFNGMSIRGTGTCVIGNNFHSGINCSILTSNHNYHGSKIPYDENMINKTVTIEDQVWIGDNVLILGGAILREGCIIQAGSVVVGEIPAMSIAGGNPAKVFKMRNIEHYCECKKKCKFI